MMRLKNLVCSFFILTFLSSNSFCMQENGKEGERSDENKKVTEKCEKEIEKKVILHGQYLHNLLNNCVKNESSPEAREKMLEKIAHKNSIGYCLRKAEVSMDDISEELKKELPEDSILNTALKVSMLSVFFSWACKRIANCFCDFNEVMQSEESIVSGGIDAFKKEMSKQVGEEGCLELDQKKAEKLEWFDNEINFSKDQDGVLKVKFLNKDYQKFSDFEKDKKKTCCELMWFAVTLATRDKEFFIESLKKAKVNDKFHNVFYNQLSQNVPKIEEKIYGNIYGRELQTNS